MYSISMYGGLLLFSGLMLYNTQKVVQTAETYPLIDHRGQGYDPINQYVSILFFSCHFSSNSTVLSRGIRSLFGPTRKSSPWGNFSDGGLNQSIKRRLSIVNLSVDWLIDWRKVNFDLIGLLDSYRPICFYGGRS